MSPPVCVSPLPPPPTSMLRTRIISLPHGTNALLCKVFKGRSPGEALSPDADGLQQPIVPELGKSTAWVRDPRGQAPVGYDQVWAPAGPRLEHCSAQCSISGVTVSGCSGCITLEEVGG